MKNKLLIISILISNTVFVYAQAISVVTEANSEFLATNDGTIVRNYHDQYSIGFLTCKLGSCFYSTAIQEFSAPSSIPLTSGLKMLLNCNWIINDIQVHNDYIYFCGTDGSNNGLFGRFNISDLLMAGSHTISAYSTTLPISCLNKLVVVDNGDFIGMTAIGYFISTIDTQDVIMEVRSYTHATSSTHYTLLPRVDNSHRENVHDVLTVGDSIFFVGIDTRATFNTLYVRRSNKHFVLGSSEIDFKHYFFPTASSGLVAGFSTKSAVVNEHFISIAHLCNSTSVGTSLRINTIDAQFSLNSVSVHELPGVNRSILKEMKYLPNVNNLVLLYSDAGSLFTDSRYLIWRPNNTSPYSTSMLYDSNNKYSSLDLLGSDSFISAYKSQWYLQRTYNGYLTAFCNPYSIKIINIINPYTKMDVTDPISNTPIGTNPISCISLTTPINISVDCYH